MLTALDAARPLQETSSHEGIDTMRLSAIHALAAASVIASTWMIGCDSHDDDGHSHASDAGAHTSPYPACNEITQACHEVDVGDGPIHECHDKAHAAKSEGDCSPIKDDCLKICREAKADAGAGADAAGGH